MPCLTFFHYLYRSFGLHHCVLLDRFLVISISQKLIMVREKCNANTLGSLAISYANSDCWTFYSDRLSVRLKTENINRNRRVRPLTFMATCARSATVLFMVTLDTKVTRVPVVDIFTLLPSCQYSNGSIFNPGYRGYQLLVSLPLL
jgi:hypothetical protein